MCGLPGPASPAKASPLGGAIKAVETGYFQREIQKSAYDYQRRVDAGEQIVVGVNRWATDVESPNEAWSVDPRIRDEQCRFLAEVKAGRDSAQVKLMLTELEQIAAGEGPLFESIIACVEAYCTIGEISDVLRSQWGEYVEQVVI